MARPEAKIYLAELEKLAGMQCTDEEIAAFFGVSVKTIERRREVPKFRELNTPVTVPSLANRRRLTALPDFRSLTKPGVSPRLYV